MKKPSLKHIPLGLLILFLVRSLILNSVSLNEVLLIGILGSLTAFYELQLEGKSVKQFNEQISLLTKSFNEQIKELKDNDNRQETILKDTHNVISTMKVSAGIRNVR